MYLNITLNNNWQNCTDRKFWTFSQSFGGKPSVFISAKYARGTKPEDAMYAWLENLSFRSFEICVREFFPFDGKHKDTTVVSQLVYALHLAEQ